jgi:hypothetical protein
VVNCGPTMRNGRKQRRASGRCLASWSPAATSPLIATESSSTSRPEKS